jgi:NAD(P)-dependent dehydrogenase (short-subunit alcohol dehydrogenase family)
MTTPPLAGKTALVTGGSRGIGRAAALRLARDGAFVIVHYGASEDQAREVLDAIHAAGGRGALVQADLAQDSTIAPLAQQVRAILQRDAGTSQLDILVNNAGIAPFVGFADTDAATIDRIFAVNVKAPFLLTAQLADALPDGGRVIFVSSEVSKKSFAGITAYAASKGAVDTLVLQLANELGPKGVRVTGVAPGAIDTDMSAWLGSNEGQAQAFAMQALQRVGKPEDIAGTIAFLAGPDAGWVTGVVVPTSGGTKL